ncbi:MAG: hypothetical protein RhofKO_15020 [Rhodothermales bacterium]
MHAHFERLPPERLSGLGAGCERKEKEKNEEEAAIHRKGQRLARQDEVSPPETTKPMPHEVQHGLCIR